jgi:hypothetical protein
MRGLKRDDSARVIVRGHALMQNIRRGHYELGVDARASTAREAIARGLRGLPGNEVANRARMRLEHQAGNLAAVRNAYTELLSSLDDLDAEPSTETCARCGQLLRPAVR